MTNPSAIILAVFATFYSKVFVGWKKLEDATIHGDGFTVNFYRLSERTIDRNCDALNGWYNVWTDYKFELITESGKRTMTVKSGETAGKLFRHFNGIEAVEIEGEGTLSASECAEIAFDALKDWVK